MTEYEAAAAINPEYPAARFALAQHLHSHGDSKGAAQHYAAALEADPAHPAAHNNLAAVLFADHDYEAAAEHYAAAVKYASAEDASEVPRAELVYNLGKTELELGRFNESATHLEASLGAAKVPMTHTHTVVLML